MNLTFKWSKTTDPRDHGVSHLRVNGVCVGRITYNFEMTRPWRISCYLPMSGNTYDSYFTDAEAKEALEKHVKSWFERFK